MNGEIIHEYLHDVLNKIRKYGSHVSLESGRGISQPKRHPTISEGAIRAGERSFLLITWMDRNLKETGVPSK